ncbi:MAG: glycosyltransferase [Planctomycetes bacterium]|nr:glycosyltransferase [Planctomycetota bacterium]
MIDIVTFTSLFPSALAPTHGLFVHERMARVVAAGGFGWQVIAPVPLAPWPLRFGAFLQHARQPGREVWRGVTIAHPRYRHWPGLSMRRQARAMARGAAAAIAAAARDRQIVLDAHYLWPDGVAAALLARQFGVPYTLTARGSDLNVLAKDPVVAAGIADAARGARACLAVSSPLCERFAAVSGLPRERIHLARNGVDLERFRVSDGPAARQRLQLPPHVPLLLGVGRLVAGKGFDVAATALASLSDDVRLVLVGDGPERAAIAAAGGDRVLFLGTRTPDEVADAMAACDLLVLPSEREGWPNVVTEALASGLRVVATAVGGIPEILGDPPPADRSLGALVPPRDAPALARAIGAVLAVPGDRQRVRAFATRYGWHEPVQMLVDLFRSATPGP